MKLKPEPTSQLRYDTKLGNNIVNDTAFLIGMTLCLLGFLLAGLSVALLVLRAVQRGRILASEYRPFSSKTRGRQGALS